MRILSIFTLILVTSMSFAQEVIYSTNNHVIHYNLVGDSIEINIEILNDATLTPENNGVLDVADDYVILMLDDNSNGTIDNPSLSDISFTYDGSASNKICAAYLQNSTSNTGCGSVTTNARANVQLASTGFNSVAHVVFTFFIPKVELIKNDKICARFGFKIHEGGTALSSAVNIPASSDEYFVSPYLPVQLYEDVKLEGSGNYCEGDTIYANADYPFYFWNTLSDQKFTVVGLDGEYGLTINDGTCILSDSIDVNIMDASLCNGNKFRFSNMVSPNSDGRNDVFGLLIQESLLSEISSWEGAELKIYNRWGIELKTIQNGVPSWNLLNENGKLITAGTYFYTFIPPTEVEGRTVVNGFFYVVY